MSKVIQWGCYQADKFKLWFSRGISKCEWNKVVNFGLHATNFCDFEFPYTASVFRRKYRSKIQQWSTLFTCGTVNIHFPWSRLFIIIYSRNILVSGQTELFSSHLNILHRWRFDSMFTYTVQLEMAKNQLTEFEPPTIWLNHYVAHLITSLAFLLADLVKMNKLADQEKLIVLSPAVFW